MRKVAVGLAIALLASTFMLGASVSAEGGEHCQAADDGSTAETCIADTREGDRGAGDDETCEDYRGFTGATTQANQEATGTQADAIAGGEETCDQNFFGNEDDSQRLFVDLEAEQESVGSVEADAEWEQETSYGTTTSGISTSFFAPTEAGSAGGDAEWSDGFGGPSAGYSVFANAQGANHFTYSDVPTGEVAPPSPPNPGWGDVAPDDLFEETLPSDE